MLEVGGEEWTTDFYDCYDLIGSVKIITIIKICGLFFVIKPPTPNLKHQTSYFQLPTSNLQPESR
jgi:hypothetical protein